MLLALATVATGCFSLGTDADNATNYSMAQMFDQTLSAVPKGKKLYWLGPSAEGFALQLVSGYASVDDDTSVHYAYSAQFKGWIDVITYPSDQRAGGMNDRPRTSS